MNRGPAETEAAVPTSSTASAEPPLPDFASEVGAIAMPLQPCDPYLLHAFPSESMKEPIILLLSDGLFSCYRTPHPQRNLFPTAAELWIARPLRVPKHTLNFVLMASTSMCLHGSLNAEITYVQTEYFSSSKILWRWYINTMITFLGTIHRNNFWIWGSHRGSYEWFYLLGYTAVQTGESQPM
jgi:hypothetical protein